MQASFRGFRLAVHTAVKRHRTTLCVGIDPELERMPKAVRLLFANRGPQYGLEHYADSLIQAASSVVPAVKFQSAFFEAFGAPGFLALKNTLAKARQLGLLTILDAKRGDIASTMKAYGVMAFDEMCADSLTVTPYMGFDVIEPLLPWLRQGKGVYVVWVSSNKEGSFLQGMNTSGKELPPTNVAARLRAYLEEKFALHGVDDALGLVLGATKLPEFTAEELKSLRVRPLLMPGVGAQGGQITSLARSLIDEMAISLVPQSRAISGLQDLDEQEAAEMSLEAYTRFVTHRVSRLAEEFRL